MYALFLFPNCFVFNFGEWWNCNGWNATAFQLSTLDGWTRDRSKCRRWRDRPKKKLSESIETKWRMQVLQPHRSSAQFCNLMHYVYDGAVVVFDAAALSRRATAIFWKMNARSTHSLTRTKFCLCILMHVEEPTGLVWFGSVHRLRTLSVALILHTQKCARIIMQYSNLCTVLP